jgi:hypothetical protein
MVTCVPGLWAVSELIGGMWFLCADYASQGPGRVIRIEPLPRRRWLRDLAVDLVEGAGRE